MRYLLDTCVLSELVRPRPEPRVREWVAARDEHALFLSVITLGELQKGVAKLPSTDRRDELAEWIEHDLALRFADRLLPVDAEVCRAWGQLLGEAEKKGSPLAAIDTLIAATARVHDCVVATRNESDMAPTGIGILNPWVEV